jgi:hypothetical protein
MTRDRRTTWNDAEPEDEAAVELFRPRSDEARTDAACPAPELVQALHTGVLPPPLQERVAAHVARCVVCQTLGEALADPDVGSLTPEEHERILGRVRGELDRSTRAFWSRSWQLSAAVACVALVAAGSMFVWRSRSGPTAPAPSRRTVIVHVPEALSAFHLEKPWTQAPAETGLVWRGSPQPEEAGVLARALEPYDANDFVEAARRLQEVVSRYPQSAAGHFYLGVSELFLGRDAAGAIALEHAERLAKGNAELAREARWYLALAYQRMGQTARAASLLDALCKAPSLRAAQACAGLRELSASSPTPRSR